MKKKLKQLLALVLTLALVVGSEMCIRDRSWPQGHDRKGQQ